MKNTDSNLSAERACRGKAAKRKTVFKVPCEVGGKARLKRHILRARMCNNLPNDFIFPQHKYSNGCCKSQDICTSLQQSIKKTTTKTKVRTITATRTAYSERQR